jgi:hypothetical protein
MSRSAPVRDRVGNEWVRDAVSLGANQNANNVEDSPTVLRMGVTVIVDEFPSRGNGCSSFQGQWLPFPPEARSAVK